MRVPWSSSSHWPHVRSLRCSARSSPQMGRRTVAMGKVLAKVLSPSCRTRTLHCTLLMCSYPGETKKCSQKKICACSTMRISDSLHKGEVAARALFALFLIITTVLASFEAMGARVMDSPWSRLITMISLVGAIYLGLNKDFYLPFLGPTVIPTSVLKLGTPPDASVSVSVDAPKNATHVLYWASTPSNVPLESPMVAYKGFKNAGVVEVAGGRATLRLACPGAYRVGWGKLLAKHVHYRYIFANGAMSSVKTANVSCP